MPASPEAAPAAGTPLVAAPNPLRKQTLLGLSPTLPESTVATSTEPSPAQTSEPPKTSEPAATEAPLAAKPMRGQTLLGLSPPAVAQAIAAGPKADAAEQSVSPLLTADAVAPAEVSHSPEAAGTAPLSPGPAPSTTATASAGSSPASPAAPSVGPSIAIATSALSSDAPTTRSVGTSAAPTSSPQAAFSDDLPELQPKRPRWLVPLSLAAVLALGVVGLRKLDRPPAPLPPELAHPIQVDKPNAAKAAAASAEVANSDEVAAPANAVDAPAASAAADAPAVAPSAVPGPSGDAPLAAPSAAAPADSAAAPADSAAASPAPAAASASTGDGPITIQLVSKPPGARLFWKGKEVGTTPLTLHFQPGEKHAYELGMPGFMTRKVVVDGTKTDISIGLRPDPSASPSTKPRK